MTITPISSVAVAAHKAELAKINSDWAKLLTLGEQLEASKIKFVNIGREVGLTLQGLCQHSQMRMSFFENIKPELPESLTFQAIQRCIKLSTAFPNPIKTLQEAAEAEQLLFLAAGLEEEPKRLGQQVSHESTPDTFVWNTLAAAKDRLVRKFAEIESWDEDTRASVKEQLEKHKQWIQEVEEKL